MKSGILKIASAAAFILFFLCGSGLLYRVFSWKDTSGDYYSSTDQLYSMKKNTVDVAFFGPSSYYASLNPAVFWEQDGIASFNAAVSGQDRNASTYFVKELLKKQSPQVVVVSATYLYTDTYAVQGNLLRNTLSLKASLNSTLLARDLVSKNAAVATPNDTKSFLLRWPIIHNRYLELKREDFVPVKEYENSLGFVYNFNYGSISEFSPASSDPSQAHPISEANKQWIMELKALGEKKGFQVIVVSVPTEMSAENRACLNGCYQYFDEIGISYLDLNFHLAEMDFDPYADMTDGNHATITGADKISRYLADYLLSKYSLPDRRGDQRYERYEKCLETHKHRILETEEIPYLDSIQLCELSNTYRGLVTSITLHPGNESAAEFEELLKGAGVSASEIAAGGTWILKDGVVLCRPVSKVYGYLVCAGDYLHVTPGETRGADTVSVGKTVYVTPENEGCCVLTYDTILGKVIDVREIH